ncbi:MAG: glucosamine-6-phosphate deaminase [Vicinamibacterales bacterium]
MHIRLCPTPAAVAATAATLVKQRIGANPSLVIGLPTGATPIPMYRALVKAHQQGRVDFSGVTTFNLDEFLGVGTGHAGSYRTFMREHLFAHVNLSARRTHVPDGLTDDWQQECARYERAIARAGGLDLVIVGIGRNGHLGFNEPAPTLTARTHRVKLRPESRRANAALFGGRWQDVPAWALSMGIGTILNAREVVLLATGDAKSTILRRALQGPITTRVPASLLQLHPRVTAIADVDAGRALR